jgi:hypothetical protein
MGPDLFFNHPGVRLDGADDLGASSVTRPQC